MNKYLNPKNYFKFLTNKLLYLISPIIKIWENKYINKYGNISLKHQPVFIIGAPRTGSTILYQIITNELDVLYIDNLACFFNKNLFFGLWLSNKLFKQKAHYCFKSKHGDTFECGLHAPSECGNFWYRWLPTDRHFIDHNDITDKMVNEIRQEITAMINYFDKPVIFKNLNAGQRMRLIKKCFPNAKFIFIKRNPLYTAQSILKSKRTLGLKDNEFWSVKPYNIRYLKQLNSYEQIIKQIFYIEKQIIKDKTLFIKANFFIINYEELCDNLDEILNKCKKFIKVSNKSIYNRPDINLMDKITISNEEINKITKEITKLDWENYID